MKYKCMPLQNYSTSQYRADSKAAIFELYDRYYLPVAVTITFKQAVRYDSHLGSYRELDFAAAEAAVRNFLNSASRSFFCRQERKKQKMHLFGIGYLEGYPNASSAGLTRLHFHGSIGGFKNESFYKISKNEFEDIKMKLATAIAKQNFSYSEYDTKLIGDCLLFSGGFAENQRRWKEYIFKTYNPDQPERLVLCVRKEDNTPLI